MKILKRKRLSIYTKQVEDLELLISDIKVASAIIHYDETIPHLHIVGVPIKEKNKNGSLNKLVNLMYLLKNLNKITRQYENSMY